MKRFVFSLTFSFTASLLGCGSRCFSDREPADYVFEYDEMVDGRVSVCEQGDHWTGVIPAGRHRFVFSTSRGAKVLVRISEGTGLGTYLCNGIDAGTTSCVSTETDGRTIAMVFDTTGGEAVVDVNQGGPCSGFYLECGKSDPYHFEFTSCEGCGP